MEPGPDFSWVYCDVDCSSNKSTKWIIIHIKDRRQLFPPLVIFPTKVTSIVSLQLIILTAAVHYITCQNSYWSCSSWPYRWWSIRTVSILLIPGGSQGKMEPIPADTGWEAGYLRANIQRETTIHTYSPILNDFGQWEDGMVPRENPHTHTWGTCKLHTVRPQLTHKTVLTNPQYINNNINTYMNLKAGASAHQKFCT